MEWNMAIFWQLRDLRGHMVDSEFIAPPMTKLGEAHIRIAWWKEKKNQHIPIQYMT